MRITRLICIIILILLFSCETAKNSKVKIRLGVPARTSFLPVLLASQNKIFEKYGLDVDIIFNENLTDLYAERRLDIICTGLTEPILFSSDGHGTQIVYRFSYSLANDIIIANSKFKSLDQLRKKKISFDGINTSSHIFVQQLLSKKGILEGEYYAVNLPVNQVIEALQSGKIDAGHTNGLSLSEIEKMGFNIIGKSSDDPDLLSDTLSVDSKFLERFPDLINKIILSLEESRNFYKSHPDESISIIADKIGKTPLQIKEELKAIRFLSIKENIQTLKKEESEATNSLYSQGTSLGGGSIQSMSFNPIGDKGGLFIAGQTVIQFLRERGQLYRMPDLKSIINDSFVKNQGHNETIP